MILESADAIGTSTSSRNSEVIHAGGKICHKYTSSQAKQKVPMKKNLRMGKCQRLCACVTGIYYPPGSLKAKLCVEGRNRIYDYCKAHDVPYKRIGKILVASDESQLDDLRRYKETALRNGVNYLMCQGSNFEACCLCSILPADQAQGNPES